MKRVALVTDAESLPIDFDMDLLLSAFEARGLRPEVAHWTDPVVNWAGYDAVLLRSPWTYKDHLPEFLTWCRHVDAVTRLFNPLDVISWGLDKTYMQDLADHGVPIVPTTYLTAGQDVEAGLLGVLRQHPESDEMVVKPTVGAYSENVGRFPRSDLARAQAHVERLFGQGQTAIVQPYLTSIDTCGETDMIYFNGDYSHAIRKVPLLMPDGTVNVPTTDARSPRTASEAEKAVGAQALAAVSRLFGLTQPLLYARIDLILDQDGSPVILEMEISEPSLSLPFAPGSPDRFADALAQRLTTAAAPQPAMAKLVDQ